RASSSPPSRLRSTMLPEELPLHSLALDNPELFSFWRVLFIAKVFAFSLVSRGLYAREAERLIALAPAPPAAGCGCLQRRRPSARPSTVPRGRSGAAARPRALVPHPRPVDPHHAW